MREAILRVHLPLLATVCLVVLHDPHRVTRIPLKRSAGTVGRSPLQAIARQTPIKFEANAGQTDSRVQFLARRGGRIIFLTSTEAVFRAGSEVVRMQMDGSNPDSHAEGLDLQLVKSNYFRGTGSSQWQTGIENFGRVRFHEVYPGIDVIYRGDSEDLEYDWIVRPGADPNRILLKFEGVESLDLTAGGDLVLRTASGSLTHKKPNIFQKSGLHSTEVIEGKYEILDGFRVRLDIGAYDRRLPLIVDPVLVYSSYLGGSGLDQGNAIAVDSTGAAYVGGTTASSNFPVFPARTAPPGQGFITKVSPDGKTIVYSTYISGTSSITGLAIDASGEVFVTGSTSSTDFPTVNAFQSKLNKDILSHDSAFVSKLNAAGNALLYSTYLGGSQDDEGKAIAVDAAGSAYVAGDAFSADFPVVKAIQSKKSSSIDVFVTKFSPDGSTLQYSTFLGGDSGDKSFGIAVDPSGNAYVTGQTASTNYPTFNALQSTFQFAAAFVTKINPSGTAFVYSTYLGGVGASGSTVGYAIAADSSGNAYVGGADSTNVLPARTLCPLCGGGTDGFVTKLGPTGSVFYSAYLAGPSLDKVMGIAVNSRGEPWVTGLTSSSTFPTTADAIMKPQSIFATQVFITHLSRTGNTIIYSTCLSGTNSGDDEGHAIALDANDDPYVTGMADSTDFPTLTPFQKNKGTTNTGPYDGDAFVLKMSSGPALPVIGNILNGASFQAGIAANSWGTIQGAYLSTVTDTWDKFIVNGKLPTSLDNVTVMIGGQLAYLSYVSPDQINFVAPNVSPGQQQVVVTNSLGVSRSFTATVGAFAPAFFLWPNNQPVATRQDFSWAAKNGSFPGTTTVPAKPGDVIILWGVGFGATSTATTPGFLTPSDRTYSTATLPTITINTISALTYGAALAPGFAALYQIAIQVPATLPDGDWPIVARIGGVSSASGVLLSVHR